MSGSWRPGAVVAATHDGDAGGALAAMDVGRVRCVTVRRPSADQVSPTESSGTERARRSSVVSSRPWTAWAEAT